MAAESTTQLTKISKDGKDAGTVDAPAAVFGLTPNTHVMHLAVLRELANARSGTACAKTRAEVRGGGKKPWKQKGTGRARAGSIRSPLWVGGGVIFGPRPRDFSFDLPKKVRRLAMRSSLSSARTKIKVLDDFSFLSGKTKEVASILKNLELVGKNVLILVDYKAKENQHIFLAARNLPKTKVSLPGNLSVKDVTHADAILLTQGALNELTERFASTKETAAAASAPKAKKETKKEEAAS